MRLPGVPPYNVMKNTKIVNKIKTGQNRPHLLGGVLYRIFLQRDIISGINKEWGWFIKKRQKLREGNLKKKWKKKNPKGIVWKIFKY